MKKITVCGILVMILLNCKFGYGEVRFEQCNNFNDWSGEYIENIAFANRTILGPVTLTATGANSWINIYKHYDNSIGLIATLNIASLGGENAEIGVRKNEIAHTISGNLIQGNVGIIKKGENYKIIYYLVERNSSHEIVNHDVCSGYIAKSINPINNNITIGIARLNNVIYFYANGYPLVEYSLSNINTYITSQCDLYAWSGNGGQVEATFINTEIVFLDDNNDNDGDDDGDGDKVCVFQPDSSEKFTYENFPNASVGYKNWSSFHTNNILGIRIWIESNKQTSSCPSARTEIHVVIDRNFIGIRDGVCTLALPEEINVCYNGIRVYYTKINSGTIVWPSYDACSNDAAKLVTDAALGIIPGMGSIQLILNTGGLIKRCTNHPFDGTEFEMSNSHDNITVPWEMPGLAFISEPASCVEVRISVEESIDTVQSLISSKKMSFAVNFKYTDLGGGYPVIIGGGEVSLVQAHIPR